MTLLGIADYPAFAAAVLVFLMLPGPGTFALLSATAQGGLRGGAAATAGIIAGDQILMWLAVAGVAALLAAWPVAFSVVQWAGAVYLAWIGVKLLRSRDTEASPIRLQPRHYARQAFLITLLNPKAIVFYMAFFPLFIDPATHRGATTFMAMALSIAGITAVYGVALCALAERVTERVRTSPRVARLLQRVAGAILIAFSIRMLQN
jgi:leucine efflux protein